MKKIGLIISKKKGGGAEVIFQNILKGFSDKYQTQIYYHAEDSSKSRFLRFFNSFSRIKKLFVNTDLVISGLHEENILCILLPGPKSKVISIHNNEFPRGIFLILHDIIYRIAVNKSVNFVFPSKGLLLKYQSRIPNLEGVVIRNGLISENVLTAMNKNRDINLAKKANIKFLFSGRLVYQKNIPLLLLSFSKIKKSITNSTLTIVGEGNELETAKQLVKLFKLNNCVSFMSWTEDLTEVYRDHDVLLFTSRFEGFGNTIIEAIASGLLVISTDCEYGPREILIGNKSINFDNVSYIITKKFILIKYTSDCHNEEVSDRFKNAFLSYLARKYEIKYERTYQEILRPFTIENMTKSYEQYLKC